MKGKRFIQAFIVLACLTYILPGCKKNNSSQPATENNTQGGKYYLTGTVNGVSWKADVVAAGDTTNLIIIIGAQMVNKDTSAIVLSFPDLATINQSYPFNFSVNSSLAGYLSNTSNTTLYFYATIYSVGGSTGDFTITKLDRTANMVSGIYTATVTNNSSKNTLTITNGTFNMPFVMSTPSLPSNIKY